MTFAFRLLSQNLIESKSLSVEDAEMKLVELLGKELPQYLEDGGTPAKL